MSKERELLEKKMAEYKADTSCMTFAAHRHLKEQLAQLPREPVSDGQLEVWYSQHTWAMDKQEYIWGFRDAEKAHGIGVDDE